MEKKKKDRKTEFFHRAKKSASVFSSCSKNYFHLYSPDSKFRTSWKSEIRYERNYSDKKRERERERDEIKENNKLLKKIIENDGKL